MDPDGWRHPGVRVKAVGDRNELISYHLMALHKGGSPSIIMSCFKEQLGRRGRERARTKFMPPDSLVDCQ